MQYWATLCECWTCGMQENICLITQDIHNSPLGLEEATPRMKTLNATSAKPAWEAELSATAQPGVLTTLGEKTISARQYLLIPFRRFVIDWNCFKGSAGSSCPFAAWNQGKWRVPGSSNCKCAPSRLSWGVCTVVVHWGWEGSSAATYERNILPHMLRWRKNWTANNIRENSVHIDFLPFFGKTWRWTFFKVIILLTCFIHCDNLKTFSVIMQMLFEVTKSTSLGVSCIINRSIMKLMSQPGSGYLENKHMKLSKPMAWCTSDSLTGTGRYFVPGPVTKNKFRLCFRSLQENRGIKHACSHHYTESPHKT